MSFDTSAIRRDFPILARKIKGHRLVYLDNTATTQKPRAVIEAESRFYSTSNANVHRGIHTLAEEATAGYEEVREKTAKFVGAPDPRGIIFTRNATESINLVAQAWARHNLKPGDEILLTVMDHHSNLVPWQMVARETGAVLKHAGLTPEGLLDLADFRGKLGPRTKIAAFTHASNVLGTINPVAEMAAAARKTGTLVLVDGAQSAPHMAVNFPQIGADFFAFSAHKMLGPTGVGVLVGRPELLEKMEPFLGGGEMIREVRLESSTWNDLPWKFEAGTPNIAGVMAFGAALDYLSSLGMDAVRNHERELTAYALDKLESLGGVAVLGPRDPAKRGGVIAFNDASIHPHDLATVLDSDGVAIRAGHHCAQPLHRHLGLSASARASFYVYNDRDDVDALIAGLRHARSFFSIPSLSPRPGGRGEGEGGKGDS